MNNKNENVEFLQAICDACQTVSEELDLTAHELIVGVAANLGRFVAVASTESDEASLDDLKKLALDVFEEGINAEPV
ncbi:MAG: hypothetical protein CL568_01920 [Alphaproteobacteria bacterium]|jgi:hypothetical protein|nr:hypothetical protein [Alphaproteobacteria bacterium]PPR13369.1 MAG: hypothetical protein CFH42_01119 [Alphaproteobacteria bacterium MarineAlpha12_Bin1]|tara:strand:+ start:10262 stop:10492 length:231 start_codon:yes stop_codon:yes gene_type:complete